MKLIKIAIATTALLAATATAAQADVFSGTHPKLGTVNLSMNSVAVDTGRNFKNETGYWYSISAGNIRAYGTGAHNEDRYNRLKTLGIRIEDQDNSGEVCRGTLGTKWVGNNLGVVFEYDAGTTCPVAGEIYQLVLQKQPDNIGMAIGHTGSPVERIWFYADKFARTKGNSYVLPGDLITIGEGRGPAIPVSKNGVSGFLGYDRYLKNQRYPSWGV